MAHGSFAPVARTIEWCRACLIDDGPTAPSDGKAGPIVRMAYVAILAMAVLPWVTTEYPPLHDYYHWMFEGHIVARLLPWGPAADEATSAAWRLDWGPTPNLGAPLAIGILGTWLSPPTATRLFALACILTFGLGFAYLARSVQRRPTIVELLGFPWAYGFLTYEGYLSNHFAFGLSFFAIGKIHRSAEDPAREPGWVDYGILAALGAVIYSCHLIGWLTLGCVVCVYGLRLVLRGHRRRGLLLGATLLPSLSMLGWYVARQSGKLDPKFYAGIASKIAANVDPLMLFYRMDPFPPLFSVFWSNVVGGACILALVVTGLAPREERGARPLQLAAALCGVTAVLIPLRALGGAICPDGRLMLAAFALFLAAWPCGKLGFRRALPALVILPLLLFYHTVEFARAGRRLAAIHSTLERFAPPDGPTLSLTLWGPQDVGCEAEAGKSFGTPVLTWFDLVRLLETDDVHTALMETSLVQFNPGYGPDQADHFCKMQSLETLERYPAYRWWVEQFPVLEIMGCPADIRAFRRLLHRDYDSAVETEWLIVLRGPPGEKKKWASSW